MQYDPELNSLQENRILIITLFSGESEFSACLSSINSQKYKNYSHAIIKNKPNFEAHQELYQMIMRSSKEYSIFIKIDADMVLCDDSILTKIVTEFEKDKTLDHATFSVRDWASQKDIMGMHAYSAKVIWPDSKERLFVDPNPVFPGTRRIYNGNPSPVAYHSPNPSLGQAYLLGYHRALKIVQRGRAKPEEKPANTHFSFLNDIWKAYRKGGDIRRLAAILGAEDVFSGNASLMIKKDTIDTDSRLRFLTAIGEGAFVERFHSRWDDNELIYKLRRYKYLGFPFFWKHTKKIIKKMLRIFWKHTKKIIKKMLRIYD
jgi:hypothetical protein